MTGLGVHVPSQRTSAAQIAAASGLPVEVVIHKLGIREKAAPGVDDHPSAMAVLAARHALAEAGIEAAQVDVVISMTEEHKEYPVWTSGIKLGHDLGAANAYAFDLGQKCGTGVLGLKLARDLIRADPDVNTVLLAGGNRAEFFAMLFGCAKAGLILVPLNWRLAEPELRALLADCTPSVLIHGAEFAAVAANLQACAGIGVRVTVGATQACASDTGDSHSYDNDLANMQPDPSPPPTRDPDTPWYLLYTAGTTGRPKGVVQTFRMMLANYLNIGTAVNLTGDDVLLNVLPVFHTAGINLYSTAMFVVGGSVLIARGFEPEQTLAALEQRATVFFGVPAVYLALLGQPGFSGERLSRVRSWGCGGAALSLPVAQRYVDAGIRVRTGMGMTETGPTVFLLDEAHVLDKIGSVGRPQLLAETRIVNPDDTDVPPGEPGELLIRGPGVTPGYWQQLEATAQAFTPDGWLRSGDIATCDQDGCFRIVDRRKDMFISGGENVYPAEIEKILEQHPAVREVAVIGVADERWGEAQG